MEKNIKIKIKNDIKGNSLKLIFKDNININSFTKFPKISSKNRNIRSNNANIRSNVSSQVKKPNINKFFENKLLKEKKFIVKNPLDHHIKKIENNLKFKIILKPKLNYKQKPNILHLINQTENMNPLVLRSNKSKNSPNEEYLKKSNKYLLLLTKKFAKEKLKNNELLNFTFGKNN